MARMIVAANENTTSPGATSRMKSQSRGFLRFAVPGSDCAASLLNLMRDALDFLLRQRLRSTTPQQACQFLAVEDSDVTSACPIHKPTRQRENWQHENRRADRTGKPHGQPRSLALGLFQRVLGRPHWKPQRLPVEHYGCIGLALALPWLREAVCPGPRRRSIPIGDRRRARARRFRRTRNPIASAGPTKQAARTPTTIANCCPSSPIRSPRQKR